MKSLLAIVLSVVLTGALVTAAAASEAADARVLAMGGVRAGLANGASAFLDNPAGLPELDTFGLRLSPWPIIASGTVTLDADVDQWSILGGARNAARTQGLGAGVWHASAPGWDADFIGAGYGVDVLGRDTSLGIAVIREDRTSTQSPEQNGGGDATIINLGAMKRFEDPLNTWRAGIVLRDLTDERGNGPTFDLGASVDLPAGFLVAADLVDLTDEVGSQVNLGAQWAIPLTSFLVRAGLADGDLTAGAGYRVSGFEVSAAWADFAGGDEFVVSATGCF